MFEQSYNQYKGVVMDIEFSRKIKKILFNFVRLRLDLRVLISMEIRIKISTSLHSRASLPSHFLEGSYNHPLTKRIRYCIEN